MEDEVIVPQPEVTTGNEPQPVIPDVEGGEPAAPAPKPEDSRTSDFKELRAHNKELTRALKEQSEMLAKLSERIPEREVPSVERLVKPTLAMFSGDTEAYETALEHYTDTKHAIRGQDSVRKLQEQESARSEQDHHVNVEFEQKLSLARQTLPDLDGAFARIQKDNVGSNISDAAVRGIKASPAAAELFHFLEANRGETAKIERLSAKDQIPALRAIEGWIMRGGYRPAPVAAAPSDIETALGNIPDATPSRTPPRPTGGSGVTHTPSLAKASTPGDYLSAYRAELKRVNG